MGFFDEIKNIGKEAQEAYGGSNKENKGGQSAIEALRWHLREREGQRVNIQSVDEDITSNSAWVKVHTDMESPLPPLNSLKVIEMPIRVPPGIPIPTWPHEDDELFVEGMFVAEKKFGGIQIPVVLNKTTCSYLISERMANAWAREIALRNGKINLAVEGYKDLFKWITSNISAIANWISGSSSTKKVRLKGNVLWSIRHELPIPRKGNCPYIWLRVKLEKLFLNGIEFMDTGNKLRFVSCCYTNAFSIRESSVMLPSPNTGVTIEGTLMPEYSVWIDKMIDEDTGASYIG